MNSPFPKSSSAAGEGRVIAELQPNGLSGLATITYQYPLKLISPAVSADQKSVLVFLLSYGGGLVGGDRINLSIDVQPEARLSIVTQGHTKIFKSDSSEVVTSQVLRVHVANGAALCLLPDPVQPFEGSVYEQIQIFKLNGSASLCLLDWVTQGRTARGENWSFVSWKGRNEVWTTQDSVTAKERLLVRDAVILQTNEPEAQTNALRDTMYGLGVVGTLILRGPVVKEIGDFFLAEFEALPRVGARDFRSAEDREREETTRTAREKWRAERLKVEKQQGILWSAASVRSCTVVKFGATTVEAGRMWIGSMLAHEGSLSRHFGDQALMCVR